MMYKNKHGWETKKFVKSQKDDSLPYPKKKGGEK